MEAWNGGGYQGKLGIYLHVPFCPPRRPPKKVRQLFSASNQVLKGGASALCGFCNLYAMVGIEGKDYIAKFVDALCAEIDYARSTGLVSKAEVTSVYFGGGTPSLLTPKQFEPIIESLQRFGGPISPDIEFALEASPDTFSLDQEKLNQQRLNDLVALGFNRISLGVQTFNDAEMDYIGRPYGGALNEKVLAGALDAGFSNVNGDLILGLPLQTEQSFIDSLQKMIRIGPQTITVYQHLIRKGTRFGQEKEAGFLEEHDNAFVASNYLRAKDILENSGYLQESLNRWAKPQVGGYKQQEHEFNLVPTIGFGPSARTYAPSGHYSSDYVVNSALVKDSTNTWATTISNKQFPATVGVSLCEEEAKNRHVIFKLMTSDGVHDHIFSEQFGLSVFEAFGAEFLALKNSGLIKESATGGIHLSSKGLQYSSPIAERLFFSSAVIAGETDYQVV